MGIFLFVLFTSFPLSAQLGRPVAHPNKGAIKNCEIRVVSKYHKGGQGVEVHYFKTKSKAECQKISESYSVNFAHGKVKRVEVHMTWRGRK